MLMAAAATDAVSGVLLVLLPFVHKEMVPQKEV